MKWKTDEGEYGNGCLKKVNGFVLNELIMIEMLILLIDSFVKEANN